MRFFLPLTKRIFFPIQQRTLLFLLIFKIIMTSTKIRRSPMEITLVMDWVLSHLKYRRPTLKGGGILDYAPNLALGTKKHHVERLRYLPCCIQKT